MRNKRQLWVWVTVLFIILLLVMSFSITLGAARISFVNVWQVIFSKIHHMITLIPLFENWQLNFHFKDTTETIVWDLRLPRILLGAIVGAALGLAGAIYQGVLRNPLADPFILGVSSGASFGAAMVLVFGWEIVILQSFTLPFVAFIFGILSLMIVYYLSRVNDQIRLETIILSGVVVQAFVGACLSFVLSLFNEQIQTIVFWMMGSLALTDWSYNQIIFPVILLSSFVALFFAKELNMLGLGEEAAHHSGLAVQRTRMILLIIASIMTSAAVSVSGAIGFVGLVVPHMIRLIFGADYRIILPLSILGGAIFLVGADAVARTLLAPREIPLGVITAFLGAPFFGYLLRRAKKAYF